MFVKSAFDDILYRFVPCLIFSSIAYNLINFQKVWTEDDFYNVSSGKIIASGDCSRSTLPFERLGSCVRIKNWH